MNEEMELEALKAQMTDNQRREMAQIVAAEVRRREGLKQTAGAGASPSAGRLSGARPATKSGVRSSRLGQELPPEAVGEMYNDLNKKLVEIRRRKLEAKTAELDALRGKVSASTRRAFSSGQVRSSLLLGTVLILGGAKVGFSMGLFGSGKGAATSEVAAETTPLGMLALPSETLASGDSFALPNAPETKPGASTAQSSAPQNPLAGGTLQAATVIGERRGGAWNETEKMLLLELDARRVELEKRRESLDQREADLRTQSQALADRLAELKSLTLRLSQVRKEHTQQYDTRMEQLATVYGSMAPNEAAPLIARLDEQTSLLLLKKMPSKRMGQILSAMEPERAVRLTKVLTEQGSTDEPAPE